MSKYYIPEDFNALEVPLDDGTEVTFEVIMVFEVEGREYIALTPAAEDGEEGDEVEVTMFRYDSGKDEDMLEDIETEEELDKVYEAFDEIFESEEFQAAIEE
ncbi:MAG: DUF1292 domain-containing protein [Lachnospiraceae bacterium]|nr:DUF1292 domain-containing protein [Lachnospiraceae bacterium]